MPERLDAAAAVILQIVSAGAPQNRSDESGCGTVILRIADALFAILGRFPRLGREILRLVSRHNLQWRRVSLTKGDARKFAAVLGRNFQRGRIEAAKGDSYGLALFVVSAHYQKEHHAQYEVETQRWKVSYTPASDELLCQEAGFEQERRHRAPQT